MAATPLYAELAQELSVAAAQATRQGALHDAIELARHALRLTPPEEGGYHERVLLLARYLASAGEHRRATELLGERIDTLPAGPARAAAHLLLADGAPTFSVEQEHLDKAIAESAKDPGLRAQALAQRAEKLAVNQGASCVPRRASPGQGGFPASVSQRGRARRDHLRPGAHPAAG
jgi:hypothetical protein